MKKILTAFMLLALSAAAYSNGLDELRLTGAEVPADVPPASGAPAAPPANTMACAMTLEYKEKVTQIVILQLWKELDGDAVVACPGHDPVRLRLQGGGPSLGLGLPNSSPFSSVHGVTTGSISIRVPVPLEAKNLEGDYVQFGPSIGGVGLAPWVNTDAGLGMTIYLPTDFNASAAISLQRLRLYLMP